MPLPPQVADVPAGGEDPMGAAFIGLRFRAARGTTDAISTMPPPPALIRDAPARWCSDYAAWLTCAASNRHPATVLIQVRVYRTCAMNEVPPVAGRLSIML